MLSQSFAAALGLRFHLVVHDDLFEAYSSSSSSALMPPYRNADGRWHFDILALLRMCTRTEEVCCAQKRIIPDRIDIGYWHAGNAAWMMSS